MTIPFSKTPPTEPGAYWWSSTADDERPELQHEQFIDSHVDAALELVRAKRAAEGSEV